MFLFICIELLASLKQDFGILGEKGFCSTYTILEGVYRNREVYKIEGG